MEDFQAGLITGEYDVSLDDKGRFRLPSALMKKLGKKRKTQTLDLVIHAGLENCLWMWRADMYFHFRQKLSTMNFMNSSQRQFKRLITRGMTELSTDKADRVILREKLLEYAGMEKKGNAILTGLDYYVEIWLPEAYDLSFEMSGEKSHEVGDRVMGGGKELGAEVENIDMGNIFLDFGNPNPNGNNTTIEQ